MNWDGLRKELDGYTKDELLDALVDSAVKGGDSGWYSFSDFKSTLKRIHRENAIKEAERKEDEAHNEFLEAKSDVQGIVEKVAAKIGKKPEEVTLKDVIDDSEFFDDYMKKNERFIKAEGKYRKAYNRYIDTLSGEEREIPNNEEEKEEEK